MTYKPLWHVLQLYTSQQADLRGDPKAFQIEPGNEFVERRRIHLAILSEQTRL
jgi:hypothetical protein